MSDSWAPLITCEHGGNAVPEAYRTLFRGREDLLASHRGFDPGALFTAEMLSGRLDAPLFAANITRLLVDLNRSPGHSRLFSEVTQPLSPKTRQDILAAFYHPHREAVTAAVSDLLSRGHRVVHVASHSFTPILDSVERHGDIGLLYDPERPDERALCLAWQRELLREEPTLVVRRNYPYKGVADGLVTALRHRFGERYLGVELEVNQRFVASGRQDLERVSDLLTRALAFVLEQALAGTL